MDSSTISSSRSEKSTQALSVLAKMMHEQTQLVNAMAAAANRPARTSEEAARIAHEKEELAQRVLYLQGQMTAATEDASRMSSYTGGSTFAGGSTFPAGSTYAGGSSTVQDSTTRGGSSFPGSYTDGFSHPGTYTGGATFANGTSSYQEGYSQAPRQFTGDASTFPGSAFAGSYASGSGAYPPSAYSQGGYSQGGYSQGFTQDGYSQPQMHLQRGYTQPGYPPAEYDMPVQAQYNMAQGGYPLDSYERGNEYSGNYISGSSSVHSGMGRSVRSNHSRSSRTRGLPPPCDGNDSTYASGPNYPIMVSAELGGQPVHHTGRLDDEYSMGSESYHSNRSGRSIKSARSNRSGRSNKSSRSTGMSIGSGRSSRSGKSSKSKKKKNHGFEPPVPDFVREQNPPGSQTWRTISRACTFIVPDVCVPKDGVGPKQAWREKVTICLIAIAFSLFIVGGIGFLPIFFCRSSTRYTADEAKSQNPSWVTVYGGLYDLGAFNHPGGAQTVRDFQGKDASKLFPRLPVGWLPEYCTSKNKTNYIKANFLEPVCDLTIDELQNNAFCHVNQVGLDGARSYLKVYREGSLVVPQWELGKGDQQWIRIDKNIYNVTQYVDSLRDPITRKIEKSSSHPNALLSEDLHRVLVNKLNQDATTVFYDVFKDDAQIYMQCFDELFFEARLDDRYDPTCRSIGVFMYFFLFFIAGLLFIQVGCSMLYLARKHRVFHEDDLQAAVMVMVPCYNEGNIELEKTCNSVLRTNYPSENKVMCIVADGVITGSGESRSTPEICAKILGFEMDFERDDTHHYRGLGKNRDNYAGVYAGTCKKEFEGVERELKYIVIVKRGGPDERNSNRAGNRGKRDSQLVLTGLFNRIHYNREPSELDIALVKSLFSLGLPAKDIEYLMTIDADTRVHEESMSHMVYHMEHDKLVLACCGETQVDNKSSSWVTMIQVFEYYSSHHLKKAFESVFGCVTCLPGCFTMYRVFTDEMKCLISNDQVYIDYARNDIPSLHEKNLFELGEDRMLTTLLLQHFPGMRLSFVPEAMCWTIVPHTLKILLSQRRRWINSTFHNMYELLKVETMCGICCLSMKTVVVMDLVITMVLPASLAYIVYLTYLFISDPASIDMFIIIFYGVTFGMQMISFLIRSRWDYLWWFFLFTFLGIPVFYFLLPIYAFTHMDDFSWGKTRTVAADEVSKKEENEERSTKRIIIKPASLPEEAAPRRQDGVRLTRNTRPPNLSKRKGDSRIGYIVGNSDGGPSVVSQAHSAGSGALNAPSVVSGLTVFTESGPSEGAEDAPSNESGSHGASEGAPFVSEFPNAAISAQPGMPEASPSVVENLDQELQGKYEL